MMSTLEERLNALESALSIMQSEHISDIKQLTERVDLLQQQIAEQRKRVSDVGASLHQRFDSLERMLSAQFKEIMAKFDTSDHFATRTWGVVEDQNHDVKKLKEQMVEIKQSTNEIHNKLDLVLDRLPPS